MGTSSSLEYRDLSQLKGPFNVHPIFDDTKEMNKKNTSNSFIYLLTFTSAIGGFLFGYDTGIISGAMLLIQEPNVFNLNIFQREVVVSSAIAGCIVGSLTAIFMNAKCGRKPVIMLASVLFTLGSFIMGIAISYTMLSFGRIIVGLAVGLSSMTIPMYIAEAAPAESRGVLMILNTVFCTGGQFIAALVSGALSETQEGWRYMLGLGAIPSMIQSIGFFFMPESPRWLVKHGEREKAVLVLEKIRCTKDIRDEMKEIYADYNSIKLNNVEKSSSTYDNIKEIFHKPTSKALMIGCVLQALQQFSGINTIMYYGATIMRLAGFTKTSDAIWLSAGIAFGNFLFTFVGIYFVDKTGRRKLTLFSLGGIIFFLVLLGFSFLATTLNSSSAIGYGQCSFASNCFDCFSKSNCGVCVLPDNTKICIDGNETMPLGGNHICQFHEYMSWHFDECPNENIKWTNWAIFVALFLYLGCYASGMGSMPWVINAEIYPLHLRSVGVGIATAVNWICNLIVSFSFLSLMEACTSYGTFWIFGTIVSIGWLYLYYHLPETKGKTLENVDELFKSQ